VATLLAKTTSVRRGGGIAKLREELARRDEIIAQGDQAVKFLNAQMADLKKIVVQRDEGIRFLRMEMSRLSSEPVQQREWWDTQFANSWERNSGPAQTAHFMQRLIANLTTREHDFLSSRPLRILDWGCAMGDGLNELAKAFPLCDLVGMDISGVAIQKARLKYPGLTFVETERGILEDHVDVVVTSNLLEHFDAALEWLERLLVASRWLVIVLVPYREQEPLVEGHRVSLSEDSFPEVFRGFTRLCARPIQVDPSIWGGSQLLVVYGSSPYIKEFVVPA